MYNIRGCYDWGKMSLILLAIIELIYWLIRTSRRRGGDGVKRVEGGIRYFSPLSVLLYKRT